MRALSITFSLLLAAGCGEEMTYGDCDVTVYNSRVVYEVGDRTITAGSCEDASAEKCASLDIEEACGLTGDEPEGGEDDATPGRALDPREESPDLEVGQLPSGPLDEVTPM